MFNSTPFTAAKSLALAASVSLIALSGPAFADMVKVSKIEVETTYAAAQDSNAVAYFPEIAADIAAAISARVLASDDMDDPKIKVDLRKVALDGNTILPDTAEFNQMEGVGVITSPNGTPVELTFPVRISAQSADMPVLDGFTVIAPDETDFYNAMVVGFADAVIQKLEGINMNGG